MKSQILTLLILLGLLVMSLGAGWVASEAFQIAREWSTSTGRPIG